MGNSLRRVPRSGRLNTPRRAPPTEPQWLVQVEQQTYSCGAGARCWSAWLFRAQRASARLTAGQGVTLSEELRVRVPWLQSRLARRLVRAGSPNFVAAL